MIKSRQHLRVPLAFPVRIKVLDQDQDFVATRTEDISWGGAFVVMDPPAPLGARVVIQFTLPDKSVALELWGRVVRRVKTSELGPAGIGVQFEPLDDDSRSLIQRLVYDGVKNLAQRVAVRS